MGGSLCYRIHGTLPLHESVKIVHWPRPAELFRLSVEQNVLALIVGMHKPGARATRDENESDDKKDPHKLATIRSGKAVGVALPGRGLCNGRG